MPSGGQAQVCGDGEVVLIAITRAESIPGGEKVLCSLLRYIDPSYPGPWENFRQAEVRGGSRVHRDAFSHHLYSPPCVT
ncbi:hypothetical protein Bpfe_014789 [Biomphalaria pfeifferi]|uniref:Uncharacterized protein n=1 Tax=Biomphalaria pfeifferi TaxID=112525 RepID=A0AAD8BJE0_BIOPF|nr:hypothetical protein Bpfe_014789 [Biomphalaria pfeifferi]